MIGFGVAAMVEQEEDKARLAAVGVSRFAEEEDAGEDKDESAQTR